MFFNFLQVADKKMSHSDNKGHFWVLCKQFGLILSHNCEISFLESKCSLFSYFFLPVSGRSAYPHILLSHSPQWEGWKFYDGRNILWSV